MKKLIKNNILAITILLIFGIIVLNGDYISLQEFKQNEEYRQTMLEECNGIIKTSQNKEEVELCKEAIKTESLEYDFYTVFADVLVWRVQYIYYLAFLIVTVPTLYKICKILKTKSIINTSTRESHQSFLKRFFKISYQYIWILPLLSLIMIIPLMMNTTLDPSHSILNSTSPWSSNIIYHPALFVISYLVYMTICSIIFINISLLVARFQQKFIPCVILSYTVYFAIEIFLETVIGIILFTKILNSGFGILFNILNTFTFHDSYGIPALLLVNLSLAIISFGLVYLAYKNKEKLVIQCEKNK